MRRDRIKRAVLIGAGQCGRGMIGILLSRAALTDICLDITPVFPAANRGRTISALLQPGKLLHMEAADVHTGGSVANTGLAVKLLGNDVELLGKIGKDAFGEIVKSVAAAYGAGGPIEDEDAPPPVPWCWPFRALTRRPVPPLQRQKAPAE
mgnify:CR=1 FL=1